MLGLLSTSRRPSRDKGYARIYHSISKILAVTVGIRCLEINRVSYRRLTTSRRRYYSRILFTSNGGYAGEVARCSKESESTKIISAMLSTQACEYWWRTIAGAEMREIDPLSSVYRNAPTDNKGVSTPRLYRRP